MKISMRWLGRYVDLDDKAPQQVLLDLTMSTAEVEGIEEFGAAIDDVVVGHVLTREKDPDADKLSVTTPDKKFTVRTVACFGQCALAPVVEVDHAIRGHVTEQALIREVEELRREGPR